MRWKKRSMIADRITVLRDGKLVATSPTKGMTRDALVRMMIGRDVTASHYAKHERRPGRTSRAGEARRKGALGRKRDDGRRRQEHVVLCLSTAKSSACSDWSALGASEIAQIICGARKRNFLRGGMIYLRGRPVRYRVPRQAIRDGIAYITEDRKVDGFFETMTVDQNIYLGFLIVAARATVLLFDAAR